MSDDGENDQDSQRGARNPAVDAPTVLPSPRFAVSGPVHWCVVHAHAVKQLLFIGTGSTTPARLSELDQ